ncbi:MAG: tetratricopeptide repeat protein [Candidatus Melainabacteria bacterium]|nr:tetratricopeptide repeat protein [Candidatus Melainabacteria bacterium]
MNRLTRRLLKRVGLPEGWLKIFLFCYLSLATSASLPVVLASPEPAPSRGELAKLSQAELIRLNNPFDKHYFQLIDALVLKYPHSPQLHLQRGVALADCSRWSESLKDLNEALVLDKSLAGSASLHFQLGNCYAGVKQYEKAAKEYELSLAKYGSKGTDGAEAQNCCLRLAQTYFRLGKREACTKAYYRAAGMTNSGGFSHMEMAENLHKCGYDLEATALLFQLLDIKAREHVLMKAAGLVEKFGGLKKKMEFLSRCQEKYPRSVGLLDLCLETAERLQDKSKQTYFTGLAKAHMSSPEEKILFEASALTSRGHDRAALKRLDRLKEPLPEAIRVRMASLKGRIYFKQKRYEQSLEQLDKLDLYREPREYELLSRATSRFELGKYDGAVQDFNCLIKNFPDTDYIVSRAHCYEATSQWLKAIEDFNRVIALGPRKKASFAWYRISQCRKRLGDSTGEIKAIETAMRLEPANYMFSINYGQALADRGDFEAAISTLTRLVKARPDWPMPLTERAKVYKKMGRADLARRDEAAAAGMSGSLARDMGIK